MALEGYMHALFPPVEPQPHLVLSIADIAKPVASVVLAHRTDDRAGHFVKLVLGLEAHLKSFLGVAHLLPCDLICLSHYELVESHQGCPLNGQLKMLLLLLEHFRHIFNLFL